MITPEMLPGDLGSNINGPSLIRAPDWLPNALGRYYLHFAHHSGDHIRLAYADAVEGPYRIYEPGTLNLLQCPLVRGHIASPDVHVDHEARQIVMYFHGPSRAEGGQMSYRAVSDDGIHFAPVSGPLGIFYFRVWSHGGATYALGKARLYRSTDGGVTFEEGPIVLEVPGSGRDMNEPGNIRHTAVRVQGDTAEIYFSRQGDAPESIRVGEIDMTLPWEEWRVNASRLVLAPTERWEGADLPVRPSSSGAARDPENAVRDPAIYEEGGHVYLLYSLKGEQGIALAELLQMK